MPTDLAQQLTEIESVGVVTDGKIVGHPDFASYLEALEGKTVRWKLTVEDTK